MNLDQLLNKARENGIHYAINITGDEFRLRHVSTDLGWHENLEELEQALEKDLEYRLSNTRERPPVNRGNPAKFRKGLGWDYTESGQ